MEPLFGDYVAMALDKANIKRQMYIVKKNFFTECKYSSEYSIKSLSPANLVSKVSVGTPEIEAPEFKRHHARLKDIQYKNVTAFEVSENERHEKKCD